MTTDQAILHLLGSAEGHSQPQDTVWRHLEDESFLVAPAQLGTTHHPAELIIEVVGTLPAQIQGWSLLLG